MLVVGPGVSRGVSFGGESHLIALVQKMLPGAVKEVCEFMYNVVAYLRLRRSYREFKPDLVYERHNLYFLAGAILRHRRNTPFYLEVNSPLAAERRRYSGLRLSRLAHALERWTWKSADRVLVVSGVLKQILVAEGVPAERVIVVPNGVDQSAFSGLPRPAQGASVVTLGFVGFIRDWHGLDGIIMGLATDRGSPPLRVIVIGDGPARPALEQRARALGVDDRVEFRGLIERDAIPSQIACFDIALQPSAVSYASPLKLFEYMAAGCAIVAPDQPNIREILTNGESACLFPPENLAAMWQAIRRLACDPNLRERLGRSARHALGERQYTWQHNVERIIEAAANDAASPSGCASHERCANLPARPESR